MDDAGCSIISASRIDVEADVTRSPLAGDDLRALRGLAAAALVVVAASMLVISSVFFAVGERGLRVLVAVVVGVASAADSTAAATLLLLSFFGERARFVLVAKERREEPKRLPPFPNEDEDVFRLVNENGLRDDDEKEAAFPSEDTASSLIC